MFKFDLQCFGGGKKAKTSYTNAKLPDATSTETSLLQNQLGYINNTNNSANRLQQLGDNALSNTVTPNYQSLYNSYLSNTNSNQNTLNALQKQVSNAGSNNTSANANYTGLLGSSISDMNTGSTALNSEYNNAMLKNQNTMNDLTSGNLPSSYAENRQKALQSDLDSTIGSTLSSLASRGIINSSQADSAINNISKNASNTLSSQYTTDMNTAANLANQSYSNDLSGLNAKTSLWGNTYNNNQSGVMNQANVNNQSYANQLNNASAVANLANQSNSLASNAISTGASTQNSSLQAPSSYYTMAQLNNSDNEDLLTNMMKLRYSLAAPAQATVQQGSGGFWGGLTSGLAGTFCFVAGTLIACIHGSKPIETIQEGDAIVSFGVIEDVIKLHEMGEKPIVHVETTSLAVDTTESEKFLTMDGWKALYELTVGTVIMTVHGFEPITVIERTDRVEPVFELELTGQNTFYANGILAEGLTEEDKTNNANSTDTQPTEPTIPEPTDEPEEPTTKTKPKRTYKKKVSE